MLGLPRDSRPKETQQSRGSRKHAVHLCRKGLFLSQRTGSGRGNGPLRGLLQSSLKAKQRRFLFPSDALCVGTLRKACRKATVFRDKTT